ncbi:UNVERIFIED_CONTAM: hypothetical protein GTU68_048988 [Idotea baltica]|nr:hypothetical protein [Idotea baltica]
MIADILVNIAGDKVDFESLMGPGVDPHLYKATQGDLKKLNNADIIFYTGLHLEGKLQDIFEKLSLKKRVHAVTENIHDSRFIIVENDLNDEVLYDPHFWFDIELWAEAVDVVNQVLIEAQPSLEASVSQAANLYKQKLKNLQEKVKKGMASILPADNRIIITTHDAFHYLGRAHNIEVKALQGVSTVAEFGLKDISNLVNVIIKRKVKSIFVENSVSSKAIQSVIKGCKDKGYEVNMGGTLYADALGDKNGPAGSYIKMIEYNLETIIKGLK